MRENKKEENPTTQCPVTPSRSDLIGSLGSGDRGENKMYQLGSPQSHTVVDITQGALARDIATKLNLGHVGFITSIEREA